MMGQGAIADRAHERLGKSDAGIVLLRRLFWREMERLKANEATKNQASRWCRRAQAMLVMRISKTVAASKIMAKRML